MRTLADTNNEIIVFPERIFDFEYLNRENTAFIIYWRSLSFKSDDSCTLLYIRPSKTTTVAHFNSKLLFLHVFLNIWVDLGGSSFRKPSRFTSGIEILGARRRPGARYNCPAARGGVGGGGWLNFNNWNLETLYNWSFGN